MPKGYKLIEYLEEKVFMDVWWKPHRFEAPGGEILEVFVYQGIYEMEVLLFSGNVSDDEEKGFFRFKMDVEDGTTLRADKAIWCGVYDRMKQIRDAIQEVADDLGHFLGISILTALVNKIDAALLLPALYEFDGTRLAVIPWYGEDFYLVTTSSGMTVNFPWINVKVQVESANLGSGKYEVTLENKDNVSLDFFLPTMWGLTHLVACNPSGFVLPESWETMHQVAITGIVDKCLGGQQYIKIWEGDSNGHRHRTYLVRLSEKRGCLLLDTEEKESGGMGVAFRSSEWRYGTIVWMFTQTEGFHLNESALEERSPLSLFTTIAKYMTQLATISASDFPWAGDIAEKAGQFANNIGQPVPRTLRSAIGRQGDALTVLDYTGYISMARTGPIFVMETQNLDLVIRVDDNGTVVVEDMVPFLKDLRAAVVDWNVLVKRFYAKRFGRLLHDPAVPTRDQYEAIFAAVQDASGVNLSQMVPTPRGKAPSRMAA